MSSNNNRPSSLRPFGLRDKIGYMFGNFGNDFTFVFASSFLMIFYTKVLGVSGGMVGTLFLVSRILDAFTDITMGRIVDTAKPAKDGRFRPWIRRVCVPVTVASFLMYQYGVADWPMWAKIVYIYVTYLVWGSIFYTGINIPYGSMASVISSDAGDRASLSIFRNLGTTLANLMIGVGVPLIVYTSDAQGNQVAVPERFTLIAGIFAVLSLICYILCYKLCVERVQVSKVEKEKAQSPKELIASIGKNRALLAIIGAAMASLLAMFLVTSMNNYVYLDYFKDKNMLSIVTLVMTGVSLAIAPFSTAIAKKFGKKESGAVALIITAITYFVMYVLRTESAVVFIVLTGVSYIGVAYFNMIIWAYITDVIDYQEVLTYKREDGTVYAVYSFARKVGQALAGGIGGFALELIAYDSSAVAQTAEVNGKIYTVSTIFPAIFYLIVALILISFYPLSKKIVEQNVEELKRRHEQQN